MKGDIEVCLLYTSGSRLYSSYDYRPDGVRAKLGHGDAMHVAKIDPDRPGYQIFNVFEGGEAVPYGFALRDAQTGEVLFGEYAAEDLGRCMIGKIDPGTRGLQVWVNAVSYTHLSGGACGAESDKAAAAAG